MTQPQPLRLWPGVIAAAVIAVGMFLVLVFPEQAMLQGLFGAMGGGAVVILWWMFFSRAPWADRLIALAVIVVAELATPRFLHASIVGGAMGRMGYMLAIPLMGLGLAVGAVASRRLPAGPRRAVLVAAILLGCGVLAIGRTAGVTGGAFLNLHWRWTPTPEERLLAREATVVPPPKIVETPAPPRAEASVAPTTTPSAPAPKPAEKAPEKRPVAPVAAATETNMPWPGFRGPERDGIVHGVRINTDWTASPPKELWRRPIGPGWSSFAVGGDLLYTQEQRGEDEVVACYKVSSGEPVWRHRDAARFWESNGGAGPRGTPTLRHGRVYTFGATGLVNALDAKTGAALWSHDAASETKTTAPYWGFTSSPVVFGEIVIVGLSGKLVAYDAATGTQRWLAASHGGTYSSPHLATIDGVPQVILVRGAGAHAVSPTDGKLLWSHAWGEGGAIVQPAVTAEGNVLIAANDMMGGLGIRSLAVSRGPAGWTAKERWTTTGLKPYYNDFVLHKGHAYGFDGRILSCIDLADGSRKWKGGRYGNGQLVLLPDQDLLLVLSEDGELALVNATPDQFTERAKFKAIEGKTWNHPVLVGDVVLVRNGEEMAAFRVKVAAN